MQRSVASTCKKWAVHFPAPRTPSVARAPRWAVLITSRRRVRFLRPSLNSGSDPDGKALSLKILGISGFEGSIPFKRAHWPNLDEREYRISQGHDSAAALVVDGTVVAAVAEERISRRKHTGAFPRGAIAYCLAEAGLGIEDIDELAHGFDYAPYRSVYGVDPVSRDLYREVYSRNALLALVARDVPGFPAERVHHVGHHLAHAASAYYTSGWDECLVVVIDGMGEVQSVTVYHAHAGCLDRIAQIPAHDSIGVLKSKPKCSVTSEYNTPIESCAGICAIRSRRPACAWYTVTLCASPMPSITTTKHSSHPDV